MKGFLLPGVLAGGVVSGGVQQKVSTNSEVMKTNTSTIRLIYPQWQGGNVAAMVPEVKDPDDAARGYYLSLIHISEPTRLHSLSRMPSSA